MKSEGEWEERGGTEKEMGKERRGLKKEGKQGGKEEKEEGNEGVSRKNLATQC